MTDNVKRALFYPSCPCLNLIFIFILSYSGVIWKKTKQWCISVSVSMSGLVYMRWVTFGCRWATKSDIHGICIFQNHYTAAVIMTCLLSPSFGNLAWKAREKGRAKLTTVSPWSSFSPPLHLFYSHDKLAEELNYFSESERRRWMRRGGEEKERKRLPLP